MSRQIRNSIFNLIEGSSSGGSSWTQQMLLSELALTVITNGVQIDWKDNTEGIATTEIWGQSNGASYALLYTIEAGIVTKDDIIDPVDLRFYKIRQLIGTSYSSFTTPLNIAMLGPELVINGGFDSDSDWNTVEGVTISSGKLEFSTSDISDTIQYIGSVSGKMYLVKFEITNWVYGDAQVTLGWGDGSFLIPITGDGIYSEIISGRQYDEYNILITSLSASVFKLDNISVKEFLLGNGAWMPIKDVEGNQYEIVKIGTQLWMAENLKTTKYKDGTYIPLVTDNTEWGNLTTPGYCWYDNDINNKNIYGALYNWYAVTNEHGLAPTGWHLPTNTEWATLIAYLGGSSVAGSHLKGTGTFYWPEPNIDSDNSSGFTALPAGVRKDQTFPWFDYGLFDFINTSAWFTAYNEASANFSYYLNLSNGSGWATLQNSASKNTGFSVRCVKD